MIGINCVRADSGWDTDYDNSGFDNDYNDDYNYDSSYSGNNSGFDQGGAIIVLAFMIAAVIYIVTKHGISTENTDSSITMETEESIKEKLGMSSQELCSKTFEIYKNIQNAWSEFDYSELRKYTTDEIYNTYIMQLEVLKSKKQKNIMENIELVEKKVLKITNENNIISVDVYMNIKMYDYIVDEQNNVVRGTNKQKMNIESQITFVKSAEEQTTKCPNCKADINNNTSGKCPYCREVIIINPKSFLMSKKTCKSQRME